MQPGPTTWIGQASTPVGGSYIFHFSSTRLFSVRFVVLSVGVFSRRGFKSDALLFEPGSNTSQLQLVCFQQNNFAVFFFSCVYSFARATYEAVRSSIKQELKGAEDLEGLLAAIEDSGAIQNAADEFVRADIDVYIVTARSLCMRARLRACAPAGVRACSSSFPYSVHTIACFCRDEELFVTNISHTSPPPPLLPLLPIYLPLHLPVPSCTV